MKKIFLILVGIAILGGGMYFFVKSKQVPDQAPVAGEETGFFKSFFPFNSNKNNSNETENTNKENDTDTNTEVTDENNTEIKTEERLKQVTDFAISGMTLFMAERPVEKPPDIHTCLDSSGHLLKIRN